MVKWPWQKGAKHSEKDDPQSTINEAWDRYTHLSFKKERRNEQLSEIRKMAEQALSIDPKSVDAHVLLGYMEMEEKQYDRMEEYFLKALELSDDPYDELTWDAVIMCLDDGLKDYPRLARYLEKFYEKKKEYFVLEYLVNTYVELNHFDKALAMIDNYLLFSSKDRKKVEKLRSKIEKRFRKSGEH